MEKYVNEIIPTLCSEFKISSKMAAPKLRKVVINMGVGKLVKDTNVREALVRDLALITGQKPAVKAAKVSISAFNLRRGMPVGLIVTLRGSRMYDFVDRLFSIVLPRFRDFRGLKLTSFDKNGNYSLGIIDHTVFPEIDLGKSSAPHGFEVTIVTNTQNISQAKRLLELLGMPFEKGEKVKE